LPFWWAEALKMVTAYLSKTLYIPTGLHSVKTQNIANIYESIWRQNPIQHRHHLRVYTVPKPRISPTHASLHGVKAQNMANTHKSTRRQNPEHRQTYQSTRRQNPEHRQHIRVYTASKPRTSQTHASLHGANAYVSTRRQNPEHRQHIWVYTASKPRKSPTPTSLYGVKTQYNIAIIYGFTRCQNPEYRQHMRVYTASKPITASCPHRRQNVQSHRFCLFSFHSCISHCFA
jgi:hypothetical protein